ncbi:uncharacterized protein KGF55_001317 [Candida pseudojiufengensis]|uniref:uncharacterized protein n=1 Tax=Candida pseudojiufengensis TaxID=497109 RepID=UPI0022243BFF|nr:uncharacterized protein KGF55_001317 [Candida pseudojiufengensis]KAI5965953.1 hypothetical protein KGF55_001317 [Candida pseudojiufengensis]
MTTLASNLHKNSTSTISPPTSPTSPKSVFDSDIQPNFSNSYSSTTSLDNDTITIKNLQSQSQSQSQYTKQQISKSIVNTLKFENEAVYNLYNQYQTDEFSINQLNKSMEIMYNCNLKKGKIILTGIGKSFKLALKLEATLNSLSISSSVLHPSEALHGDLGMIQDSDILIFISSSGNSDELINILQHIDEKITILLLTNKKKSILASNKRISSLIFANLSTNINELKIHGIPAPTVSYTISLILADSLILSLSEIIETDLIKRKHKFSKKHPGGSIGSSLSMEFSKMNFKDQSENSQSQSQVENSQKSQSLSSNSNSSDSLSLSNFQLSNEEEDDDNLSSYELNLKFPHLNHGHNHNQVSHNHNQNHFNSHQINQINNNQRNLTSSNSNIKIKILNYEEILNLKEINLLKYLILYDQLKIDDLKIDTLVVKNLYKKFCLEKENETEIANESESEKESKIKIENWNKFKWILLRSFKQ